MEIVMYQNGRLKIFQRPAEIMTEAIKSVYPDYTVILDAQIPDKEDEDSPAMDFKPFRTQVEWELHAQDIADLRVYYFDPETKSPITLLELGLYATKPCVVYCPEGYFRKGNVDIVCKKYGIPVFDDKEIFKAELACRVRVMMRERW